MSPKVGRPKAENPKDASVKVRFDKETYEKLLDYCKQHEITKAEAIRQGIQMLLPNKK